jgi:hypothetical protein
VLFVCLIVVLQLVFCCVFVFFVYFVTASFCVVCDSCGFVCVTVLCEC